jgi:xanthine dehydrogenase accessory factor
VKELWNFILTREREPVMLLVVLESFGSSPGRKGFKMAVTEKEMCGSIGGGIMEHKFVELARERLRAATDTVLIRKQIHNKVAKRDQSGMICSGEQTVFLSAINQDDREQISKLADSLRKNQNGTLTITETGISFAETIPANDFEFIQTTDDTFQYTEKTGFKNLLYVIGGGHCSLAFTRLMHSMDFRIHLFEDRPQLNTFLENQFVHAKKVVEDYSKLKDIIPSGENSYVVIMTFGYRTDDLALRAIIENDFKYVGVLGSKTKISRLIEEWRQSGIPESRLQTLHSPVGIPINSQTPEEIAVSIAAEIIAVKNGIKK